MTNDVGYKTRLRNPIWRDSPKWEYSHRSDGLLYSQVEDMQPVHYVLHALARSWVDPRWRLNHMRESKYFGSRKNFVVIFENPQEHGRIEDPREVWKAFPEEFLPMFDDQERQNHHYGINGVVYVAFDLVDLRREIDLLGEQAVATVQQAEQDVGRLYGRKAELMNTLAERETPAKRRVA